MKRGRETSEVFDENFGNNRLKFPGRPLCWSGRRLWPPAVLDYG